MVVMTAGRKDGAGRLEGWGVQWVHPCAASMVSVLLVLEHRHVYSMSHQVEPASVCCRALGQRRAVALFPVCRCDRS